MTKRAIGPFDVKLAPLPVYDTTPGSPLARMSLDKTFHGDLEATSVGEMLAAGGPATGSGGYVAIEHVTGTLNGRRGTFVLQHMGTMTRGATELTITVVPDSGTDELAGLAGSLAIDIANGKHSYTFDYSIDATV